ncbi:hypothetical protein [Nocardioides jensenii]|uniref:hypothetical protein n=1 Tax=Nocardioides jensenii TaxID=1843 RepID=UPI00082D5BA4|nr:hypothetical protein [Nocardioides jensenii]
MRLRSVAPFIACLAALSLTGCDDTGSAGAATAGEAATPSDSSSLDLPAPTDDAPASPTLVTPSDPPTSQVASGTTPGGTLLSYGDPARVQVMTPNGPANLEYTVSRVDMAPSTALGQVAKITIEVRAVDNVAHALTLGFVDWEGVDNNGDATVLGFVEGCENKLPVEKPGSTGTMCVAVSLTGTGTSLSEVHYKAGDYRENPIIWKP